MRGQKRHRTAVKHVIFGMSLLLGLLAGSPVSSAAVNDARSLQETAIARIERYIDHFRRTFDRN